MNLLNSVCELITTDTVYLVSTKTGFIQPMQLSLYMARTDCDKPLKGWIPRMTRAAAEQTATKYRRN